jgi:hypothetical protein
MDSATLISLTTIIIGFVSAFTMLCIKLIFKSKCTDIQCCCIKVKRDVRAEVQCERLELGNVMPSRLTPQNSNINIPV